MNVPLSVHDVLQKKRQLLLGNEQQIALQHKNGKLTARERIAQLLDANSFVETDVFLSHKSTALGMDAVDVPGEGVVTGFGTVMGRPVYVFSQDYTALGGSLGEMHAKKICKVIDMAAKIGVPLVGIYDSVGARVEEGMDALNGYGAVMARLAQCSGVIPQIALVLGAAAGFAAVAPTMSDFVFMANSVSALYTYHPDVLKAVTGEDVQADAQMHAQQTGIAHVTAADEYEAFEKAKALICVLPSNFEEDAPLGWGDDDLNRQTPQLVDLPEDADIRLTVEAIADNGFYFELQQDYAKGMFTAFSRIGDRTVGVVANQPQIDEGKITSDAADKAARFITFCDCFNIPVVTLADSAGLAFSSAEEQKGLAKHAAALLHAYANADVAKVTLLKGKAFGAGYVAMGSRALGADYVVAWPNAQVGVLPPQLAINVLLREDITQAQDPIAAREQLAAEYAQTVEGPINAAKGGYIDDIIAPEQTRQILCAALEMAVGKREVHLPKKHGNMPF